MILRSSDGTLIFCESLLVPKARGDLLVVHGMGEYSGRYHELAEEMRSLRLNVHLFDLRGHGRSQGTRGHFSDFSEHHQDMDAWIEHLVGAGRLAAERPCFLLGHSLGGLIALTYGANYVPKALYPALAGMVLSAPALGIPKNPLRSLEAGIARHLPSFLTNIQVPSGIEAADLTHDKDEKKSYEEDPLVHGWITPSAFLAIERAIRSVAALLPKLDFPLFFLLGGKDRVVDNAATHKFIQKLSVAHRGRVEVKVFQRFLHEVFHESGKDRAFLELKKWILKQAVFSKKSSSRSSGKKATERETSP
jgi:lysophospholipase